MITEHRNARQAEADYEHFVELESRVAANRARGINSQPAEDWYRDYIAANPGAQARFYAESGLQPPRGLLVNA